jgi:protein phosphatase
MVRSHNEDSVFVDGEAGLAVLADGMGGYNAGEVASGIAVDVVSNGLLPELASGRELSKVDVQSGLTHAALLLQRQIASANKGIYEAAQSRPECAGMGTTIVAAVFHGNRVSIGHIGDSRCYRLRGEKFEQLTHDHSLLQEQIDSGQLTAEQAKYSLNKNLVTRALGIEAIVPGRHRRIPHRGERHLSPVLRRPDGHGRHGRDPQHRRRQAHRCCPRQPPSLVELANQNGGRDNISVILTRVPAEFLPSSGWAQRWLAKKKAA